MHYLTGNAQQLGATLVDALGRYRHQVFVEHLGWQLPDATPGAEWDTFDTPGTVYVVALCNHGRIAGCARLLPTTGPYLLADVFPELLNGTPCPRSAAVWELSRFAAFDPESPPARGHTLGSPAALDLLRVSLREAAQRGARQLVSVSPVAIARILHRGGFAHARLGPPREVAGQQLFACSFNVAPDEDGAGGLEATPSALEVEAQ
ncbi:acyl-homoserine-lactone synthase [Pseudacidovorax sp. RU35E]|uniref:acyl-homoserine-lactone synthase n=1 Tax=Pseudacidovorax sp. RU35E TaxID=1907403 RepID=UPI000956CF22|nr:acyl-homoserine-lactone synthase [Pseudacidovorax sp. RU35E]SIR71393.1 N-acyl-L-homoserine lactone synthetase [Pseudacidovorax sp. RU35E]